MNNKKVPFPKYLNSKRLFYKWELDIAVGVGITSTIIFIISLAIGLPIILALFTSAGISFYLLKGYVKFFKTKRKGYIEHLLYSKGFLNPMGTNKKNLKSYEENLIPLGFENEFVD